MSDELILKKKKDFLPAPEGMYEAVCVDVVNLGLVDTIWMNKVRKVHKVRIVWELDCEMPEGKGRFVIMNRYTFSMDPKSNLRKLLKTWRGQDFTQEEMNGFNLENIIGAHCKIVISHATGKDGTTYANIASILKAVKKLAPSGKYVRAKDREGYQDPVNHKEGVQEHPADDGDSSDDIPF